MQHPAHTLLEQRKQRTVVIAEISNAHNGSLDAALSLIDNAVEAGADMIKFQCYDPHELIALRGNGPAPEPWGTQGWSMLQLYQKAHTPMGWFPKMVELCDTLGVPWFSSVFGRASLSVMELLACPVYKLAALDYRQRSLRWAVQATGKPVIRSSPLPKARRKRQPPQEYQLFCPPGYPQRNVDVRRIAARHFDGFSYHGNDPLMPVLAVSHGARLIEVHVQDNEAPSELEQHVSLSMSQFAGMIQSIRALG